MTENNKNHAAGGLAGIHANRLFVGSCMSLISTAVVFGVVTSLMGDFSKVFTLSNYEAGLVGGATIWGFTISIFVFGPLCDVIGMGRLMRFAFLAHIVGPLLMIYAAKLGGFLPLFIGGVITSMANGTVEAVCNPLIVTIYPDKKTQKLNLFHMWFPGGIVIGGLAAFGIDKLGDEFWAGLPLVAWQAKLALVFVPTIIYGIIFTGQKFPHTERVQSGLSFGQMVTGTFGRPLFYLLFICMGITASLELGPGRWMGSVMNEAMAKLGVASAGILVLVYGNFLMALLRALAGPVVHRLSPTGMLVCSAILAGVGLTALTFAQSAIMIIVTATVFYVGVCYFWPTMLGVTSERVPKGGSLALALMGGWGMAVVGLVTVPAMGFVADRYGHDKLPLQETSAIIQQAGTLLPKIKEAGPADAVKNIDDTIAVVGEINATVAKGEEMPAGDTTKALRGIAKYATADAVGEKANELLAPANDYGGKVSFRWVAGLAIFLVLVFGSLYASDRSKGGYKKHDI